MNKKSLFLTLFLCSALTAANEDSFIHQKETKFFDDFEITEKHIRHHTISLSNDKESSLETQLLKKMVKITDKEFQEEIKRSGNKHYLNKRATARKIANLFQDYEETHKNQPVRSISMDLLTVDTTVESIFTGRLYLITKAIISKLKINNSKEEEGYLFFSSYPLMDE